jgi:hypothetical protein
MPPMPNSADSPNIGRSEVDPQTTKTSLEIAKLKEDIGKARLETALLDRQLNHFSLIEWLKALGTPVAVIAAGLTYFATINQQSNERSIAEEKAAEERFDKALDRLAERDNPAARMSGITELKILRIKIGPHKH